MFNFIQKPASAADILLAIWRAADGARRVQEPQSASYPLSQMPSFGSLDGDSVTAKKMLACLTDTAKLESFNALIEGPSGVLKTDVAALWPEASQPRHTQYLQYKRNI